MIFSSNLTPRLLQPAWALALLLLIPLKDTQTGGAQAAYGHTSNLLEHGRLADCQQEAAKDLRQFQSLGPAWTAKFELLEAEAMALRGLYDDTLRVLAALPATGNPDDRVRKAAIEGVIYTHQQQFSAADQSLAQAEDLCKIAYFPACGEVFRAQGTLAAKRGQLVDARRYYFDTVAFAKSHGDRFLEATAYLNLGFAAMQADRFDEATDLSRSAYQAAMDLGADDLAQIALGNLGWAYYQLGDDEKALEQFLEAEKEATRLGDIRNDLKWTSSAGYIYQKSGDLPRANESYREALFLARKINSREDIVNALGDLAQVSVDAGRLDQAATYLDQISSTERTAGNRLSADEVLTQGTLAAARRQDQQAESFFRAVQDDPKNPTTDRLIAGEQLAQLYESEGKAEAAERMYKATLLDFESARAQLKKEESKIPFVANASRIYDDYIHLLVEYGRSDEALILADQSRARTLAQSLSTPTGKSSSGLTTLNPRQVAQKSRSTLLFYWLGQKQSYLWIITPSKIARFPLPAQAEIVTRVSRYNKALQSFEDPVDTPNEDGEALFRMLVAPASKLIDAAKPVIILTDGALSQLNFETLLAPGPGPKTETSSGQSPRIHYWIEDVTLLSAPSLAMLAAAQPDQNLTRSLLLLGDPVSPNQEFPRLPLFGFEVKTVQKHFGSHNAAIFTSQQATPAAYLSSNPSAYSYIHFVTHAVSSSTDPLDSAIILSGNPASSDSFKLYARDIMLHPIHARLVTISACYGSGTRSYAGEGLVGLSWAFLRAGAHSVIGALWEVSDDSTPRLMDTLYQGLEEGETPAAALRRGKLALLDSGSAFRAPYFWAPFQLYTR